MLHTGAIPIDKTMVLRAAVFMTGYQPNYTDTQIYLFPGDNISQSADSVSLAHEWSASSFKGKVLDCEMDY